MTGVLAALCVALLAATGAGSAHAATTVKLSSVGGKKKPSSLVTFTGRAGSRAGGKVAIERKSGRRWTSIASGRTGAKGRFALTWITPDRKGSVTVRAKLGGRTSATRTVRVLAPAKGAAKVKVSPLTRIISPSVVESVPAAGQAGSVTYAGGNDAKVGQIMVVGQGEATPEGFLGKVTDVERKGGETIVDTVPATLLQAVPEGSMDLVAESVKAARAGALAKSSVTCEGAVGASITHSVDFSSGLRLKGDWSFLKGGLQSVSLTADASVDASVQAIIGAAGSCSLARRQLLSVKGPSISGFVGPVPIVMTSKLSVYLDAAASAQAQLATGANAGFSASAGVSWTKGAGFQGVQSFTPKFGFDPPTLSAGASAAINVTPTVDVLLYGIVGPRVALRTGVQFAADTTANPWWTLDVPVDLTASITIAPLDLSSPELHVYQRSFPIADAGGPLLAPGETPKPVVVNNVATPSTSIATGYAQSCALRTSGAVACWGGNGNGQLGNGTKGPSAVPVAVSGITDAAGLAAGNNQTCALRVAGSVVCWGSNAKGELGNPAAGDQTTPVAVSGITDAVAIAAGATHGCAVLVTKRVKCWGSNDQAELGDGSKTPSTTPVAVSGITNAVGIGAGTFHTCAVLATGGVSCWGSNGSGELGNGSNAPTNVPVAVSGITNATAVDAGANHSCALLATGGVSCWGMDFYGQLGNNGSKGDSNVPVAVSGITNAVAIGSGGAHTCAALATGELKCWGWNNYGQIGDGGMPNDRLTPVSVTGIANAAGVTGGLEHTCSRLTTGGVKCWGFGDDGELGDGIKSTRATPVTVTGLP